jgi:hypothetical protein
VLLCSSETKPTVFATTPLAASPKPPVLFLPTEPMSAPGELKVPRPVTIEPGGVPINAGSGGGERAWPNPPGDEPLEGATRVTRCGVNGCRSGSLRSRERPEATDNDGDGQGWTR